MSGTPLNPPVFLRRLLLSSPCHHLQTFLLLGPYGLPVTFIFTPKLFYNEDKHNDKSPLCLQRLYDHHGDGTSHTSRMDLRKQLYSPHPWAMYWNQ